MTPAVLTDPEVLDWLLDSDPSLRWQVERDLARAPAAEWQATRARVASEGFGAEVLSHQDADGQWAGGAFFPAGWTGNENEGQPWTATTWSLTSLREWGVEPGALRPDTAALLARHARWEYDSLPYWGGEVDACINAMTLANGSWLGADVSGIKAWFAENQLPDGGWNCLAVETGSVRSSFHSTISCLIGLLDDEVRTGDPVSPGLRQRAEEYLLERRLMRRLSTGEVHTPWATHFAYPYRSTYSVLRALDYFRAARRHDGGTLDPRMGEAISVVRQARKPDGTWHQQLRHGGRAWVEVDAVPGQPSKWLTFHALRVLEWADRG